MKLTVIGFGHMGSAMIEGALKAGVLKARDVTVSDLLPAGLERAAKLGVNAVSDSAEAVRGAEVVILAVKPNDLAALAEKLGGALPKSAVLVSICAGKRIAAIAELFGTEKIVRVMPNTPAQVGEGMAALCRSEAVSDSELGAVRAIFESFGRAEILPEELFDVVTAVSGSGPAYVYAFIEGLAGYAAESGMTPEQAKIFAAQTVLGAAKMTLLSEESPKILKERVCSPGGTTIEAVKVLDARGFGEIIAEAARACEAKSKLLAKG